MPLGVPDPVGGTDAERDAAGDAVGEAATEAVALGVDAAELLRVDAAELLGVDAAELLGVDTGVLLGDRVHAVPPGSTQGTPERLRVTIGSLSVAPAIDAPLASEAA